jgi:hypothetical protein
MKHRAQFLLGFLLLAGVQFASSGCVADGYVGESVYYGPHRDPWFRDDPWMDSGRRWYRDDEPRGGIRGDIYINPPRHRP